jgi:anaerobic selenocysteine-containing dehydrogenase
MSSLEQRLRNFDGPLTRELVRSPSKFGLSSLPKNLQPDATTSSVCGFCSTGCSLRVHLKDGEAINITPDRDYPVNLGMACPKGWEALAPLRAEDRGVAPLLRRSKGGEREAVSWSEASEKFVLKFSEILKKHGPESVAFLSTGQMPTEEMALLGAFAKFGMGLIHGDGNTRQCMATSVVAYKQSFGFDAPPYTYADFELSDTLVFFGANPCLAHPIMWERVLKNRNNPKIIVVDPRLTETASAATHHLAIRPKGDLPLLYGLAAELIAQGWVDQKYIEESTSGFADFESFLKDWSAERGAEEAGISLEELKTLAQNIHEGERVSFWWTMGVNQSHQGVRTAQGIINLALMTGNIGRPGTGANSITGQANAMGSRLFSNTTNLLGGRSFESKEDRDHVAGVLGIPTDRIPSSPSLDYASILEEVEKGKIKGLWVVATNPAHSWIDRSRFDRLVEKLDFLVVQDMYSSTETAIKADLYLPAAGWGEKEGTQINSERRIGLTKKVSRAPGEALSDLNIFRLLAHTWGCGELFKDWSSAEAVFRILQRLSAGTPCDFSTIESYVELDRQGGHQWPCTEKGLASERRLFGDGIYYHSDGRAKFISEEPRESPEAVSDLYPLVFMTGRGSASQWHTETRTSKSPVLRKLYPKDTWVEINDQDAKTRGIHEGDWVLISSKRASMKARARVSEGCQAGTLFVNMHDGATNLLTFAAFDPYSRQPNYKHCAVQVTLVEGQA